jgi:DedD protein
MDSANAPATPVAEDDDALRKRLLSRIAVAGVAIVGLLGGLAVYDSLNKPQAPVMPKMAAAPAEPEVTAKKEELIEEKPAEELKQAEVAPVPERTDTPLAPPPPEKSLKAAKPLTPPASARQAGTRPTAPVAAPVKPETQREIARVIPEDSRPAAAPRAPIQAQAQHAPASRPLTQAAETARRFLLQVGVFSNHANAEELLTRLHTAGIPAQIESRVQVGPFASKAEVDVARAKLKALGLDDGMLVRR